MGKVTNGFVNSKMTKKLWLLKKLNQDKLFIFIKMITVFLTLKDKKSTVFVLICNKCGVVFNNCIAVVNLLTVMVLKSNAKVKFHLLLLINAVVFKLSFLRNVLILKSLHPNLTKLMYLFLMEMISVNLLYQNNTRLPLLITNL